LSLRIADLEKTLRREAQCDEETRRLQTMPGDRPYHGWDIAEIFEEPGASALDGDRPVFQEMIVKAKRAEALPCSSLFCSRVARPRGIEPRSHP